MKTIDHYMALPYRMEIIPDSEEGGFTAWYPDLPGCLTSSQTMDDIITKAIDAKKVWLEAALEEGMEITEPSEDYSGQFKLRIPKSLHRSLALHAKIEGISMNQYCNYLLAMNDAYHSFNTLKVTP